MRCVYLYQKQLKDLHGKAILDYYKNQLKNDLLIDTSYGSQEIMPVEVFFRDEMDFTTLEHLALIECKGKVLDLGAGAGATALVLQSRGYQVTALENSPGCVQVMKKSGVKEVVETNFFKHTGKYDTILLLMNGMGLAGKLNGVANLLEKCKTLLTPDGQLLVDSSDIQYLYEDKLPEDKYYGEVSYRYRYGKEIGHWFDWVYVDHHKLQDIAHSVGMSVEILFTDENDQYLACITSNKK